MLFSKIIDVYWIWKKHFKRRHIIITRSRGFVLTCWIDNNNNNKYQSEKKRIALYECWYTHPRLNRVRCKNLMPSVKWNNYKSNNWYTITPWCLFSVAFWMVLTAFRFVNMRANNKLSADCTCLHQKNSFLATTQNVLGWNRDRLSFVVRHWWFCKEISTSDAIFRTMKVLLPIS